MSKLAVFEPIRKMILEREKSFSERAGISNFPVKRFLAHSLYTIASSPELMSCTKESILRALSHAAALGIIPDGFSGLGYLIAYRNSKTGQYEAQFQPGWKGLVLLAKSVEPDLKNIVADVIYKGEKFRYERTAGEDIFEHEPSIRDGEITHAYAIARYKSGDAVVVVLSKAEVDKVKSVSKTAKAWDMWYSEMAKKTAIKRLLKQVGTSELLTKAIVHDSQIEGGEDITILDVDDKIAFTTTEEIQDIKSEDTEIKEQKTVDNDEDSKNNIEIMITKDTLNLIKAKFALYINYIEDVRNKKLTKEEVTEIKKDISRNAIGVEADRYDSLSEEQGQKILKYLKELEEKKR